MIFPSKNKGFSIIGFEHKGHSLLNKQKANVNLIERHGQTIKCHLDTDSYYWKCIVYLTPDDQFLWEAGNKNWFWFCFVLP